MRKIVKIDIPAGTAFIECRSVNCRAMVGFVKTAAGKNMPVDPDGTPHWATCPDSEEFKKRSAEKAKLDARLAELKRGGA